MRLTTIAAFCVAAFVAMPCAADDRSATTDDIERWTGQLASDSFIQRDLASRQLLQFADAAVPQLTDLAKGSNPIAARAAIDVLERMAIDNDADAGAAAHRAIAQLAADSPSLSDAQQTAIDAALRRAVRHVTGIVKALGGIIERDETLAVVSLKVQDERFNDSHAALLSRLIDLRQLDLQRCSITDQGLTAITSLPQLEELNLTDTQVTGAGIRRLAEIKTLTKLSLYHLSVERDDVRWLSGQLPDCDIRT